MRQLSARTAALAALSLQVLGCDPMAPPAREPNKEPSATDASPPNNEVKPDAGM